MTLQILVADASKGRSWIEQSIHQAGCKGVLTGSVEEAIGELKKTQYDLLLVGKSLPNLPELLRAANQPSASHLTIVGLDAKPMAEENLCLEEVSPTDAHLTLIRLFQRHLRAKRVRKQATAIVSRATSLYKINRELRQTNLRLNTIVESTRRVFSGVDEEKVLMEILQTTARYTGAAPTIIFMQRRDGLIPKIAMGVPPERLAQKPIAIAPSVWQEAQAFSTSLGEPDVEKMIVKLLGQEDFFFLPLGSGIKAHTLVVVGATPDAVDRAALRSYAPIASLAIRHARKMRELRAQVERDSLTGLLNHAAFQRYLRLEVKRHQRMERPLGVVMLDIDHFKSVNDSHGHPAGDRALRLLAETLRKNSRETDMLARYGGEEFVLVLSDTDREGAEAKMQEILQQVRATDWGDAGPLTLSAGIAMYPIDGKGPASLIEAADRALYAAKHGGRDRAISYAEWLEETLSRDNDASDAGVNIDRP